MDNKPGVTAGRAIRVRLTSGELLVIPSHKILVAGKVLDGCPVEVEKAGSSSEGLGHDRYRFRSGGECVGRKGRRREGQTGVRQRIQGLMRDRFRDGEPRDEREAYTGPHLGEVPVGEGSIGDEIIPRQRFLRQDGREGGTEADHRINLSLLRGASVGTVLSPKRSVW